jgi:5-hydroxyisourate hydrolase-like protein (transthyretin family)
VLSVLFLGLFLSATPAFADEQTSSLSSEEFAAVQAKFSMRGLGNPETVEYLYDYNGSSRFALAESPAGYLVWDIQSDFVMEWAEHESPYAGCTGTKYYGGYGLYFVQQEDVLLDIWQQEAVGEVGHLSTLDNLDTATTDVAGDFVPFAQASSKRLPYTYDYIQRLSFGDNAGNTVNTCTAVASQLALNYLDRTVDGRIVPTNYEAEPLNSAFWSSSQYPKTAALFSHLLNDCDMAPFYFPLINWTPGVWGSQAKVGIDKYRQKSDGGTSTGLMLEWTVSFSGDTIWSYITTEVDKGLPAMITTPPSTTQTNAAHTMVVVGYNNSYGQQEFEMHNGWYGDINIPSNTHRIDYISSVQPVIAYRFRVSAGLHQDNQGNKRYFNNENIAQTGWQTIAGQKYYFRPADNTPSAGPKGSAVVGLQTIDGQGYYFSSSGVMLTGLQYINGRWYEFDIDGRQLGQDLNGVYTITTTLSQPKAFDIATGSTANGAALQTYADNKTVAQRFKFIRDSNGYFTVINLKSNKALDIPSAQATAGVDIQQYTANGTDAQKWAVSSAGTGVLYLTPKLASGLHLGVSGSSTANGAKIQLQKASTTNKAQIFKLTRVDVLPQGVYNITAAHATNKALDIANGSTASGANIQLYQANGSGAQKFTFRYDSSTGYYFIVNPQSQKVLDVAGAGTANGTNVQLYSTNYTVAQAWSAERSANGYRFYSACSGLALDVAGGLSANGTNIQMHTPNGTAAQEFSLRVATQALPNGTYTIGASYTNKVLDIANGSTASGANIQLYQANGSTAQKFEVTYDTNSGLYLVANHANPLIKRALNLAANSAANGTNVVVKTQQSITNASSKVYVVNEMWAIENAGTNIFCLHSGTNGLALDAAGAGTANGTNVQVYSKNNTPAQQWKLVAAK